MTEMIWLEAPCLDLLVGYAVGFVIVLILAMSESFASGNVKGNIPTDIWLCIGAAFAWPISVPIGLCLCAARIIGGWIR